MTKRTIAVGAVCAALASAGTALSQGTAGPPTGTLDVTVRISVKSRPGINPGVPRDKTRPVVGDLITTRQALLVEGKRAGFAHHVEMTTFVPRGKKYRGGAQIINRTAYDFGGEDTLFTSCIAEDSPTPNRCVIMGGTGRYAGARGTATEGAPKEGKRFVLVPVTFRFIP